MTDGPIGFSHTTLQEIEKKKKTLSGTLSLANLPKFVGILQV
jgi:hypothetical protein